MGYPKSLILPRLSSLDRHRLAKSAEDAQRLEARWRRKIAAEIRIWGNRTIESLENDEELPAGSTFDLYGLFVEHYFDVAIEATGKAESDLERHVDPRVRLKKGQPKIPNSLRELMKLYDLWRAKEYIPKRQREFAENVRKAYLKKVQNIWRQHSAEWRAGGDVEKEQIRAKIQEAARTTYSRARTIVDTETTRHYNHARREVYDQSPDVVAYLFLAIRDHATTRWCMTRSGLVYHRGDPRLEKETPPIHWNCRSEILPLTRQNPKHLALIEDSSLDRRNHTCEPLPKGWKVA